MRIVFKTTSENLIPETIFNGTNQEFAREMFRIINSYAYKKFNIEWGEDYILLKKTKK